jgi:hypothetical protein
MDSQDLKGIKLHQITYRHNKISLKNKLKEMEHFKTVLAFDLPVVIG